MLLEDSQGVPALHGLVLANIPGEQNARVSLSCYAENLVHVNGAEQPRLVDPDNAPFDSPLDIRVDEKLSYGIRRSKPVFSKIHPACTNRRSEGMDLVARRFKRQDRLLHQACFANARCTSDARNPVGGGDDVGDRCSLIGVELLVLQLPRPLAERQADSPALACKGDHLCFLSTYMARGAKGLVAGPARENVPAATKLLHDCLYTRGSQPDLQGFCEHLFV